MFVYISLRTINVCANIPTVIRLCVY